MWRGKGCLLGVIILLLGVGGMALLMLRDIRSVISVIPGRDPRQELCIQMRDAEIHKEISGDAWSIRAPLLEKEGEVLRGYSLDVSMVGKDGREAFFFARKGTVFLEESRALLQVFQGRLCGEDGSFWQVAARLGRWEGDEKRIYLEEGFTVSSDQGVLQGETGVLHQDKTVEIRQRGTLEWEVSE